MTSKKIKFSCYSCELKDICRPVDEMEKHFMGILKILDHYDLLVSVPIAPIDVARSPLRQIGENCKYFRDEEV